MEFSETVISQIFHHSPLATLPYFSWTCRALRKQAIEIAKKSTINPDTIDVFVGRWMFRHGCQVNPPFIRERTQRDAHIEPRYMDIISSTKFPEDIYDYPRIDAFGVIDYNTPHRWAFAFSSRRNFIITTYIPGVAIFEDLFQQDRERFEYKLGNALDWALCQLPSWTREHYVLFARAKYSKRVQEFGIDGLEGLGETDLVKAMALEIGGTFFSYAVDLIDYSSITVAELSKIIDTDISGMFQKRKPLSSEFIYKLIDAGYRSEELTRFLVHGTGEALEYALTRGFQVDDKTLTKLINFVRGKNAIALLKERFGIIRYIRCMSDSDVHAVSKRVAFSECPYDDLSPDDALKVLRMFPNHYTDNAHVCKLLHIACNTKKRREPEPTKKPTKRRKT